jgi:NAD(P)H-dependent FMN reductase
MTGVCDIRVLLVSGSTRSRSTNTAALRSAHELLQPGCASLHVGLAALPAFDPDADHPPLPATVEALRSEIAAADVVVFCTPEYAGTLPGSFKNLLDWTVGGAEISDKPSTWINVAAPGRGTGADATLAVVLGYVGAAVMNTSGVRVPVAHQAVDASGRISDPDTRDRLRDAFETIIAEVATAAPRSLGSDDDRRLYNRGTAMAIACWEHFARATEGATVIHAPGVAAAVFPHAPERAVYNNAVLEHDLEPAERATASPPGRCMPADTAAPLSQLPSTSPTVRSPRGARGANPRAGRRSSRRVPRLSPKPPPNQRPDRGRRETVPSSRRTFRGGSKPRRSP